jgi:hypothetical protein
MSGPSLLLKIAITAATLGGVASVLVAFVGASTVSNQRWQRWCLYAVVVTGSFFILGIVLILIEFLMWVWR